MVAILNAKNVEDTKSFMSRQKDTYKTPYDRHPKDHKRQCVFAGSSNSLDFLPMDRSGNRRFLPILCNMEEAETHILDDEKTSREYIDQMWAEDMEEAETHILDDEKIYRPDVGRGYGNLQEWQMPAEASERDGKRAL